jgi:cystathionine beta-lyase
MDFQSPQPVIDALVNRARHGIYGYTSRSKKYNECVALWMQKRHGWTIDTAWITNTPGVVNALYNAVQAFAEPGEKILIQPPVYHPFTHAIEQTGREVVHNPLVLKNGRYEIDFADLEQKVKDPEVKLVLLCHPHNPVGRVWTEAELRRFGELCNANDVLVVSDEVHSDLIYDGIDFVTYASLGEAYAQNVIVTTSPSKTFNLPGLKTANVIIPNPDVQMKFNEQLKFNGLYGLNAFGSTAIQAAYQYGDEWLTQVMAYIQDNYRFMCDYLSENLPQVSVIEPEGTYLVWVDLRALGIEAEEIQELLLEKGKLLLDDGFIFGDLGRGFTRFNIACPRSILETALDRMCSVLGT